MIWFTACNELLFHVALRKIYHINGDMIGNTLENHDIVEKMYNADNHFTWVQFNQQYLERMGL